MDINEVKLWFLGFFCLFSGIYYLLFFLGKVKWWPAIIKPPEEIIRALALTWATLFIIIGLVLLILVSGIIPKLLS